MPVTLELERPTPTPDLFTRADLEFRGVDHSGPTYEARIFLDNKRADIKTARDAGEGYAGSFWVFGHGGCFGELGHCDIPTGPRGPFDKRPPHPLTPQFKTVIVTDALKRVLQTSDAKTLLVTVVPVVPETQFSLVKLDTDPLKFESVSLLTYEGPPSGEPPPSSSGV
jgi:hypothetical protein